MRRPSGSARGGGSVRDLLRPAAVPGISPFSRRPCERHATAAACPRPAAVPAISWICHPGIGDPRGGIAPATARHRSAWWVPFPLAHAAGRSAAVGPSFPHPVHGAGRAPKALPGTVTACPPVSLAPGGSAMPMTGCHDAGFPRSRSGGDVLALRGICASTRAVEPAGRVANFSVRSRKRCSDSPSPSGTVASRRSLLCTNGRSITASTNSARQPGVICPEAARSDARAVPAGAGDTSAAAAV